MPVTKTIAARIFILLMFIANAAIHGQTSYQPEFSTAGFFEVQGTGRSAYSMNPAWRFYKGHIDNAEKKDFDDSSWDIVSLPNGIEILPVQASGCINYQGEVWYRKHFIPSEELKGKEIFLHFEGIMGKSKIWINGNFVKEHFGGFLPAIANITEYISFEEDNVISVMADNSNDTSYPPGKSQETLDFTYFGGIYRDCWLIAHNKIYITDPNYENETAGGGLFVSYGNISKESAEIRIDTHVRNVSGKSFSGKVEYSIYDKENKLIADGNKSVRIASDKAKSTSVKIKISNPELWEPDSPYLYNLYVTVKDKNGSIVDGYRKRIGIRSIEFKGKDGFWLNGKPYPNPLIGANRHQDFAVIGNALPNSLHWRDAKKLRDAGLRVIRNAHYPQDPAFMDACDELGLFVIVNTPGWQFWNDKQPEFEQRVYSDIRNMVRRDRNHPSVWMWEPILNETWYPETFAENVVNIMKEEYPYPYCYSACDVTAKGKEFFPIHFTHPLNGGGGAFNTKVMDQNIAYFTREWGDNVDDWYSHNSPSRVNRAWGEVPMLVQAQGYAKTDYQYSNYDIFYRNTRQHMGGCLWHSFDHQRGYHPDPFFGGIMDAFRQPKLSYYMFCSQRPATKNENLISETGPMVYIANSMTPFSPKDITVYSNCDEVRLTYCKDGKQFIYKKEKTDEGMPSPIITFKDVWDVMNDRKLARADRQKDSYLLAEGYIDGQLVASHKVTPSRRPTKLILWTDDENVQLKADGSDIVTVIAAMADKDGNIKRLNNCHVIFEVEGEAELIGNEQTFTNPTMIEWGTAPILVRATNIPGKITVKARLCFNGINTPIEGEISFESVKAQNKAIADKKTLSELRQRIIDRDKNKSNSNDKSDYSKTLQELKEVGKQQGEFE